MEIDKARYWPLSWCSHLEYLPVVTMIPNWGWTNKIVWFLFSKWLLAFIIVIRYEEHDQDGGSMLIAKQGNVFLVMYRIWKLVNLIWEVWHRGGVGSRAADNFHEHSHVWTLFPVNGLNALIKTTGLVCQNVYWTRFFFYNHKEPSLFLTANQS